MRPPFVKRKLLPLAQSRLLPPPKSDQQIDLFAAGHFESPVNIFCRRIRRDVVKQGDAQGPAATSDSTPGFVAGLSEALVRDNQGPTAAQFAGHISQPIDAPRPKITRVLGS